MDILSFLGLKGKERLEANLEGARKLVEGEREKRLRDIYPDCSRICEEVRAAFVEIRKDCDLFEQSKAQMDPDLRSAVKGITRKMRENFIARMRVAVELGEPPGMEYAQFAAFSKALQETMAKITKINSDNRYIFTVYREDAARFKKPFEQAGSLSDKLKELLEEKREEAERFGKVAALIGELETEKKKMGQLGEEAELSGKRLAEKRAELAGFGASGELAKKREELSKASEEFASASGKISASITLLERALRKYGKICDPAEKPERYAETPLAELLREGEEYPKLKETLVRMKKVMEKGELELKNPEKIRGQIDWLLAGNLTPLLRGYGELKAKKARTEAELEPLMGKERERQALENSIEQLEAKLEKQTRSLEDAKAGFERRKAELGEKLREALGKEVSITD